MTQAQKKMYIYSRIIKKKAGWTITSRLFSAD